jgi:hypothetical protein
MWFKTRVGLTHVEGYFQINVSSVYDVAGVAYRSIIVRKPEIEFAPRGVFKSYDGSVVSYPAAGSYMLAAFKRDENTDTAIGQCMETIVRAIEQSVAVCDLSDQGTTEAWSDSWLMIQWPS